MPRADLARAALFSLLFLCAGYACAETPSSVTNPRKAGLGWVSDMAEVIDAATERSINERLENLNRQTSAEMAVVTIRRADGMDPKGFATELFNRWGIGRKGQDDGVLVLLVMDARRVEVETGYGAEAILTDGRIGRILDERVIPRFRDRDFGGGLAAGVEAMASALSGDAGASGSSAAPRQPDFGRRTSFPIPPEPDRVGGSPAPFLGAILVVALGGCLLYLIRQSRIPKCSQCQQRMRLLSEDQDDAYLSGDEKLEEQLGSIDYRVWRCDNCQEMKIEPARKTWSSYEDCPRCHRRTVDVDQVSVREATYDRTGLLRVSRKCRRPGCDYEKTNEQRTPRLTRPVVVVNTGGSSWGGSSHSSFGGSSHSSFGGSSHSSHSSGSFGGGSSGGGGAGRSW